LSQTEHEIIGKAHPIPHYGLVQYFRRHAINPRQIPIEDHALPTQEQDCVADVLDRGGWHALHD
jgi:hypothetical protein